MTTIYNKIELEDGSVRFGKNKERVKKNAMKILKNSAARLSPSKEEDLTAVVEEGLKNIKQINNEQKVLKWQMMTPGQKVNQFLLQKYSDSINNDTIAIVDQYDNTKKRIESGLNYEYHVYLPEKEEFAESRIENRYVISDKVSDYKVGDIYYYHIPIYFDGTDNVTDYGEKITKNGNSANKDGLLWAISELAYCLKKEIFDIDNGALSLLKSFGFINEENKLNLAIIGNVKVEKYLLSVKPDKRNFAIEYLNSKEGVIDDREQKEEELEKERKLKEEEMLKELQVRQKKIDDLEKKLANVDKAKKELNRKIAKEQNESKKAKLEKSLVKVEAKEEEFEIKKEELEEDVKEVVEEVVKEEEIKTDYDDNKNIVDNLTALGYKMNKFVRNGIGAEDFKYEPLLLINAQNKSFYLIIDKAGVAKVFSPKQLQENNEKRRENYEEMLRNNNYADIPLNESEKTYLEKRKIVINKEDPIELTKSSEFTVKDVNIHDRIKKIYNK